MRKLVFAVAAVAGMGLAAGCKSDQQKVNEERKEVAEAQREAAQKTTEAEREATQEKTQIDQNAREEMAEADREKGEEQREAQQDVREEQKDLAQAQREANEDANERATGGSGAVATTDADRNAPAGPTMTATGTLSGNQIGNQFTLKDAKGKDLKLKTDENTRIMYNNQKVDIDDFKEGTQVRASYVKQGEDNVARDVTVVRPVK